MTIHRTTVAALSLALCVHSLPSRADEAPRDRDATLVEVSSTIACPAPPASDGRDWRATLRRLARVASSGGELGAHYVALAITWPPQPSADGETARD